MRVTFISVLMFFSFVSQSVEASTRNKNRISIIIPNGSLQYMQVVKSIRKVLKLNNNNEKIAILYLSDPKSSKTNLDNEKLVVLVGSRSFDFYSKSNAKSPYLTTLITKSAFEYIFKQVKNKNNFIGGIMIDQPAKRYLALARALLPSLSKAGLVIGPENIRKKKTVFKDINRKDIDWDIVEISLNDNPINKLRRAYESSQALILFPDKKKFNRSLSRWILTLSYQYKIPVISYSKKYTEAGALASLFSTAEKMGDQTAEMMIPFLKNSRYKVNKLVDPKYYDIQINQSVAKALNIKVPTKSELLRKIIN